MLDLLMNLNDFRLLFPEAIELENEDFQQAKGISNKLASEAHQWQTYLNVLALVGFEKWLMERMPEQIVERNITKIDNAGYLNLKGFKFCLIATEHLLDEIVTVSQDVIFNSQLAAHFYVVVEVLEEEEQVIIRGFQRGDKLVDYLPKDRVNNQSNGLAIVPLSAFDSEPNHLLSYCRLLAPTTIPLPFRSSENSVAESLIKATDQLSEYWNENRTKLSQWLGGVFDSSWQAIDALISPETNLASSVRNAESGAKRGKLIDLGMQLGNQTFVLLVNVIEEAEEKLSILIQLHPTGGKRYLPSDLKVILLSKAGKTLQEVTSRSQDNYIQLKAFKGEPGKRFSIAVTLNNVSVREDFEF